MSNAPIDQNSRPAIICASQDDGTTIVPITANPSNHALSVMDGSTGSDNGNNSGNAKLDENSHPVWIAESSDGSGEIIEVYGDEATGSVLINSN